MSLTAKQVAAAAAVLIVGLGIGRAASYNFQKKRDAIRAEFAAEGKKLGLTREQLGKKFPSPQIKLVSFSCLTPGATGEITVKGNFVPGTKFVIENDNVEVTQENLTGDTYRATVKVAAGIGPQTASISAFSPTSGFTSGASEAVVIGGKYEWNLNAENGWKVTARSAAGNACTAKFSSQGSYEAAFYKPNEATPFEKRSAALHYSLYDSASYRFEISRQGASEQSLQDELMALGKKMSDANLPMAERERLMNRFMELQQKMAAQYSGGNVQEMVRKEQEKQASFGCEVISLGWQGGSATGTMRCSDKVGTRIKMTGSVKLIGQ